MYLNYCESPLCTCGKVEDVYHYFFLCIKNAEARDKFFNYVFSIDDLIIVKTHISNLLWGDDNLSNNVSYHLFSLVNIFIKNPKDFDCVFTFLSKYAN